MENVSLLIKIVINTIKTKNVYNVKSLLSSVNAKEYQLKKFVADDKINDSIYDNYFKFILK
jgi:hypothetical protein